MGGMLVPLAVVLAIGPGLTTPEPEPVPIVGGIVTDDCQWPATVLMSGCSGTLIHPEVVLYAAHCPNTNAIGFGVSGDDRQVATSFCLGAPEYPGMSGFDYKFCRLAEPVTDVPVRPDDDGMRVRPDPHRHAGRGGRLRQHQRRRRRLRDQALDRRHDRRLSQRRHDDRPVLRGREDRGVQRRLGRLDLRPARGRELAFGRHLVDGGGKLRRQLAARAGLACCPVHRGRDRARRHTVPRCGRDVESVGCVHRLSHGPRRRQRQDLGERMRSRPGQRRFDDLWPGVRRPAGCHAAHRRDRHARRRCLRWPDAHDVDRGHGRRRLGAARRLDHLRRRGPGGVRRAPLRHRDRQLPGGCVGPDRHRARLVW